MGLLDDYGLNIEDFDAPDYENPADDWYEFEVSDVFIRKGTDNYPDREWLVIRYLVGDTGKEKDEWFQLPEDPSDPTAKEAQSLGFYKRRLLSLGFDESSLNEIDRDDLIGLTGTFKLETRKGFQNITKLRMGDEAPVQAAPAKKAPTAKAPAKGPSKPARPAAKPARFVEPPAPAESDEEEDDEEEAPAPAPKRSTPPRQAAPAAKAQAAGVRKNPFG